MPEGTAANAKSALAFNAGSDARLNAACRWRSIPTTGRASCTAAWREGWIHVQNGIGASTDAGLCLRPGRCPSVSNEVSA
jgi:hypothetical protein